MCRLEKYLVELLLFECFILSNINFIFQVESLADNSVAVSELPIQDLETEEGNLNSEKLIEATMQQV